MKLILKVPARVRFDKITGRRLESGDQFIPPKLCPNCGRPIPKLEKNKQGKWVGTCCRRPIKEVCSDCGADKVLGAQYCIKCGSGRFVAKPKKANTFRICPSCGKAGTNDRCHDPSCNGSLMIGAKISGQGRTLEVTKFLGKGAMGMVYKVVSSAGETFALKEIRPLSASSPLDPELLYQNEVQSLAVLKRLPEAARIKGSFKDGMARYVLLEFIPGEDLGAVASSGVDKALAWNILFFLTRVVAEAQDLAVFRDLKASNVKLVNTNPVRVKLLDFGFVHLLNAGAFRFPQGLTLGTVGYGPPEQFGRQVLRDYAMSIHQSNPGFAWSFQLPDIDLDPKGSWDVYAIGAIGYFLATRQDPCSVLYRWDFDRVAPVNYYTPDPLRSVLEKALSQDPWARYQTAAEMWRDMSNKSGY